VRSPCISVCALDAADICIGCHRSGAEIRAWCSLGETERRAILLRSRRRAARANPFAG